MIHGVGQTTAVEPKPAKQSTTGGAAAGGGFAAELDRETKKGTKKSPAAKPAQVPEKTAPVAGHPYAEITAGPRNGMFLNTSGNERNGQAFLVVEREGRTFHVYGTGADRAVFEVKPEHRTPAATSPAGAPAPGATTAPAAAAPAAPTPAAAVPAIPTLPVAAPALPSIR